MKILPTTEEQWAMTKMPTIQSQMPIVFSTGARWDHFCGTCRGCGKDLPDDCLTGKVNRFWSNVVLMEAVGMCHQCKLLTTFNYRLHEDMSLSGHTDRGWVKWQPHRPWVQRLLRWSNRVLKGFGIS